MVYIYIYALEEIRRMLALTFLFNFLLGYIVGRPPRVLSSLGERLRLPLSDGMRETLFRYTRSRGGNICVTRRQRSRSLQPLSLLPLRSFTRTKPVPVPRAQTTKTCNLPMKFDFSARLVLSLLDRVARRRN